MSETAVVAGRGAVRARRERRAARSVPLTLRLGVSALVTALLGFELWARSNDYGLRVVGDAPMYVSMLYRLAAHPFHAVNPYFAGLSSSHATPDLQLLALLWRRLYGDAVDPVAAYRLLAAEGLVVTALVLHAFFLWVRSHVGPRAAWVSIPLLLALFGPANVIWAGDLSLHGFLYASFYSQTLGLALALYTLTAFDAGSFRKLSLGLPLLVLTMLVHPFTGLVLSGLLTLEGCRHAAMRRPGWWHSSAAIPAAFLVALAWPEYSLAGSFALPGCGTAATLAAVVVPPFLFRLVPGRTLCAPFGWIPRSVPVSATTMLAALGAIGASAMIVWQRMLIAHPPSGATTNRLAVYWVDHLGRWPLLFAGGAVGLAGLYALSRYGKPLPALWFAAAFSLGVAGALGLHVPLWYRLLLLAQLPLALGLAAGIAQVRTWLVWGLVGITVVGLLAAKTAALVGTPPTDTYLGNDWLQDGYALGKAIPPGAGAVASDPITSFMIPAATGRPILTLTPAHLGSAQERARAEHGFSLLYTLYNAQSSVDWWLAADELWHAGARYVVVDHSLSLSTPSLAGFAQHPPGVEPGGGPERQLLGRYFYRLNRIGTLVSDSPSYAVYRLNGRLLHGALPS